MYDSQCLSLCLCLDTSFFFFSQCALAITSLAALSFMPPSATFLSPGLFVSFSRVYVSAYIRSCVCGPAVNGPLHFPLLAMKEGNDL